MIKQNLSKILNNINNINNYKDLFKYSSKILDFSILKKNSDDFCNNKIYIKNYLCYKLIEKVYSFKYTKTKLSFNKILSKHLFDAKDIKQLVNNYQINNRNLGKIPLIFLEKVKNKKNTITQIYNTLAKYSLKLNFYYNKETFDKNKKDANKLENYAEKLEKELSAIINQKVKLKYIDSGLNGNGFKLTINHTDFFYKTFFPYKNNTFLKGLNHGGEVEPAMAYFTRRNNDKRFTKFYFGRIGYLFFIDSFIITEFIKPNNTKIKQKDLSYNFVDIKQFEKDKNSNNINGIIVDFGGLEVIIPEFYDKQVRKITRVIVNHIYYKFNDKKFEHIWKISKKNMEELKKYLSKQNKTDINKSLNILTKYNINFPFDIIDKLENIQINKIEKVEIHHLLNTKEIFNENIDTILETTKKYNIKNLNIRKPLPEFHSNGYAIFKINENYTFIVFFDTHKNITKLRIEKNMDNKNIIILNLNTKNEIQDFKAMDFYRLIN